MKIWHLSPMKCSICGLYACYQELPVCHHCMHVFQDMLTEKCEKCGRPPYSCDCYGNISYLFFFNSFDSKLFLYFVKCNGERRVMRFLGKFTELIQMHTTGSHTFPDCQDAHEDTVMTNQRNSQRLYLRF